MILEDSIDELIRTVDSDELELSNLRMSYLYHYCSTDIVELILNNRYVTFKMTEITDFEDKLEGRKTVLQYYKKAIDDLYNEGKLSERIFSAIQAIQLSEFCLYIPGLLDGKNAVPQAKKCDCRTFVSCFSIRKDDKVLMDQYIKRSDKKGYSLGLYFQALN